MKIEQIGLTCALVCCIVWDSPISRAAVISELSAINGPIAGAVVPVPVATTYIDNDEVSGMVNYAQPVTGLQITSTGTIEFKYLATDSGTGGTTEYLLNQLVINETGTPWTSMRYTLSAKSLAYAPITVPGLDFDWPDKTTAGLFSQNFPSVVQDQYELFWSGGVVVAGESTAFDIDVPDIGQDYLVVLTLDVPEPASALSWTTGLILLRRRRRKVSC